LEIGADQTWGVVIISGGYLPVQLY